MLKKSRTSMRPNGRPNGRALVGYLLLALLGACSGQPQVEGERITERDGVISECGVGEDLVKGVG